MTARLDSGSWGRGVWTALFLSFLITFLGVLVIFGWLTHNTVLIQVFPGFAPMQFNTALGLVFIGLGLASLSFQRASLAFIFGSSVMALALAVLLEYLFNSNFGIDEFFMKAYVLTKTSHAGRPAPNTALCFLLAGMALCSDRVWKSGFKYGIIHYLALLIIANAGAAMLGYFFHSEATYGWGSLTRMALHTSAAFLLIGTGLLAAVQRHKKSLPSAIFVFFIGVVLSFLVLQILSQVQYRKSGMEFNATAHEKMAALKREFNQTVLVLKSLRAFYEGSKSIEREEFRSFTKMLLAGGKSFRNLEWISAVPAENKEIFEQSAEADNFPGFKIRFSDGNAGGNSGFYYPVTFVEPQSANLNLMGIDRGEDPLVLKALKLSAKKDSIVATERVRRSDVLSSNRWSLLLVYPVFNNQGGTNTSGPGASPMGYVAAEIQMAFFLQSVFDGDSLNYYAFQILDVTNSEGTGVSLFDSSNFPRAERVRELESSGFYKKLYFDVGERNYALVMVPSERYMKEHQETGLWIFLILLMLGAIVASGLVSRLIESSGELKSEKEKALLAQRDLESVLQAAHQVSVISTNPEGLITFFNTGAEKMLGYSRREMIGIETPSKFHLASEVEAYSRELSVKYGRTVQGFETFIAEARQKGFDEHEWTYVRKDGSKIPVNLVVTVIRGSQNQITGYLGVAADLTERKKAEESTAKLAAIVESSEDAIFSKDLDGIIQSWNHGSEKLFGYTADEIIGQKVSILIPEGREAEFEELMRRIRNDISIQQYESVRLRKDGTQVPVSLTISPLHDSKGNLLGASVTARDMTAQRQIQINLQRSRDEALEASRLKSEFLATMSHEIRTPMNIILGMAELLGETDLDETQREYISKLRTGGDALMNLINDILDLSKIEAGSMEIESLPFRLQDLVSRTVEMFTERTAKKRINLHADIRPNLPERVMGDSTRVQQILINLINNAVKFTEKGEIKVSLEAGAADRSGRIPVTFSVEDTGVGIPAGKLHKLFKPFSQADSATTRKYGGTGLGLSICKRLVELMGGQIAVTSHEHQGSVFSFTLPMLPGEERRAEKDFPGESKPAFSPVENQNLNGSYKILLADDSEDNRLLIQAFLKKLPVEIAEARNGNEAVEKMLESSFSLVLMDMQMPEMDGYSAVRLIRSKETGSPLHRVIVALTADAMKEHRDECFAAGCDAYLAKPVRKEDLIRVLEGYLPGLRKAA